MDGTQFDELARILHSATGRRATLSFLVGTTLGLLDRANMKAGKKGKKKKKKKGRGGSPPVSPPPASPPPPPGGAPGCVSDAACNRCAQETCQAGSCACPEGFSRDAKGVCGVRPNCRARGEVAVSAQECCSGQVRQAGGIRFCEAGQDRCLSAADCAGGGACLGFMCPARYLATFGEGCRAVVGCTSPGECDSGLCRDGVCALCQDDNNCPSDAGGQCFCGNGDIDGICVSRDAVIIGIRPCSACPPGSLGCLQFPEGTECFRSCGRTFS